MSWQTPPPMLADALASATWTHRIAVPGVAATGVGDPEATRTVYTTVVILVLLGLALGALAIWVFRRTRPEPELLAPLETMDTRTWRNLDPAAQRRLLDDARPSDAAPVRREMAEPSRDRSFDSVAPVASFDDLAEGRDGPTDTEEAEHTGSPDDTTPDGPSDDAAPTGDDRDDVDDSDEAVDSEVAVDSRVAVDSEEVPADDGRAVDGEADDDSDDDTGEIVDEGGLMRMIDPLLGPLGSGGDDSSVRRRRH